MTGQRINYGQPTGMYLLIETTACEVRTAIVG